jgi:hypothetical protein
MKLGSEFIIPIVEIESRIIKRHTLVLQMVRVDRLYLGPMFSPDQLGSDQISPSWFRSR